MQVIVMTSDNYYNCLTPFMYLWQRFFFSYTEFPWLHNELDLVFCGFTEPGVELSHPWRFVSIGKFEDYPANKWSDALLWVLDNVAQDRFVLMLEDYWLCRPVDVRGVKYLYDYASQFENTLKIDLAFDRLYINAGSDFLYGLNDYGHVGHLDLLKSPHGTPYQFSLWVGIWRRDVMRRFVVPGETAQELEMRGSARVTDDVLVLGTRQGPLRHGNIYRSGRGSTPAYEENGWRVPDAEVEYMREKGWIE
jgi:hypothetical protein